VRYYTNVYTLETWERATQRGFTVTGFPPPTTTRGGYFQSTFDAVAVGDTLCCYIRSPAKRWVGAMRVDAPMRLDYEDALWGTDEDGRAKWPARFDVTPLLALAPEVGLPVEETIGVLQCLDSKTWSGLFRRSLTRMPEEDGEMLLEMLRQERTPVPVRVPRRRSPKPVAPTAAGATTIAPAPRVVAEQDRGRTHRELVWKLIQLGRNLGCDVWVASDERGRSYDGNAFAEHVLAEFPNVGLDPESRALVRTIDVLWIRGRGVTAAFEVEVTTSVYSGLLRMSDLVALSPNTSIDLFIVAPDERRQKVHDEILRPTFEAFDPPLRSRCRYISTTQLDQCIERTKPPLHRHLQPSVIRDFAEEIVAA
jgi:hypothetical protein